MMGTAPLIIARPLPGVVGETRRVCHLFTVPEGQRPYLLTALCGAKFQPVQLERLAAAAGMPCEASLRRSPDRDDQPPGEPSIEDGNREPGGSGGPRWGADA